MLAFVYLAYSMTALLYETVPAFERSLIECLGDLGRYRIAIEEDDIGDKEVWAGCARHWRSTAAGEVPTSGRLYHHLAILARPYHLQQLFYYAKSLCVAVPFTSARQSILALFDPTLKSDNGQSLLPLETALIKAHGILFARMNEEEFHSAIHEFSRLFDNDIGRRTRNFMEQGYYIAIANTISMLRFAYEETPLIKSIYLTIDTSIPAIEVSSDRNSVSTFPFWNAQNIDDTKFEIISQPIENHNVLPFLHVILELLQYDSRHPNSMSFVQAEFPWRWLTTMLNTLLLSREKPHRREAERVIRSFEIDGYCPLPKDFAMRGLSWTESYFPDSWFTNQKIDEDEKYHELRCTTAQPKERVLWLTGQICWISQSVWSQFLGMLRKRIVRSIILLNQVFNTFRNTSAAPISAMKEDQRKSDSAGFIDYFAGQLHQLRDHLSGPMVETTGYACLLTGLYYGLTHYDQGSWKGTNLLEIATTIISSYSYFFGNSEWLSDPQVAMVASLNFRLSLKILQQKLSVFPNTRLSTVFCIESASFGSAGMLTNYMPTPRGRYDNPWIQAAMLLPLTNLFFTASWTIFIRNSGLAKHLEEKSLYAATIGFIQKRLLAVLVLLLILVLLAKV